MGDKAGLVAPTVGSCSADRVTNSGHSEGHTWTSQAPCSGLDFLVAYSCVKCLGLVAIYSQVNPITGTTPKHWDSVSSRWIQKQGCKLVLGVGGCLPSTLRTLQYTFSPPVRQDGSL